MSNNHQDRNIGAYILIGIGVILLFSQLGIGFDFNWWAIFIALPGLAMLRNAYNARQAHGELDSNELIQGGIGVFLVLMSLGFLFDIELGFLWNLWPLALIAVGVSMIFGSRGR
ncbi:MAG: hypothetical protein JXN59_17030 [Anaerolineae bacterium]|nr:hypothetical protein [Anaerolineae bacterium]